MGAEVLVSAGALRAPTFSFRVGRGACALEDEFESFMQNLGLHSVFAAPVEYSTLRQSDGLDIKRWL